MSLRTRLLVAFAAVVLSALALLVFGVRREMIRRLSHEYQLRVDQVIDVIREDLALESTGIADRLASLEGALLSDNRFRLGTVAGIEAERGYLLDYAGTAMRLTGLSMLQIQDSDGAILSSGHFRNEHGRVEAGLTNALVSMRGPAFVAARSAEREFVALARAETFQIGDRSFTLVGGIALDEAFLARLARDREIDVALEVPGGRLTSVHSPSNSPTAATSENAVVGTLTFPLIRTGTGKAEVEQARMKVTQSLAPLNALLKSLDSWFLVTTLGTAATAVLLALWVSSRITRRLVALAEKTAVLDLDRLDVAFDPGTDEIGSLSRLLGDLATRLRTSTARVREAERRATVGDLARQINHDIKNGLIPLRNVMRHLTEVGRGQPGALPTVFDERRPTIDSSLAYLETLATSYQRLSRPLDRRVCDVNLLVAAVVRAAQGHDDVEFAIELAANLPSVLGDPIAIRRILENLIANAVDSLESKPGRISVSTQAMTRDHDQPIVRVTVADSGRGMTRDEAARIFEDFYTTKEGGTGLGLSIVRRLMMDLNGTVGVESSPGAGTRITIDIPCAANA
jgi:signal transduction histidine kinase